MLVVIESPFAATTANGIQEHIDYARRAMKHSLEQGEYPIASHLLYTQPGILDDTIPEERHKGMTAGLVWGARAGERAVFYCDMGVSEGMIQAAAYFRRLFKPMECRWMDGPIPSKIVEAQSLLGIV